MCQIVPMLFMAAFGRYAEPAALDHWQQIEAQQGTAAMVAHVLASPEHGRTTFTLDQVDALYTVILDRPADPVGRAYWIKQDAVATFLEFLHAAGCETTPAPHPVGWIDLGHGVYGPPILARIRWCESNDDPLARNPRSSAAGLYQFLRGSWKGHGHAARYGVPTADLATPAQQDEAAVLTYQAAGTRPWRASRSCWSNN